MEMMYATPEWMSENYNKFNQELFNGVLGDCQFEIFTTGKGSQGKTLGQFYMKNPRLRYRKRDGRMLTTGYNSEFINHDNFVELTQPCIRLNGHYKGTEEALLATLVHEMCHYYCNMYGIVPKQAHGRDFKYIASIVSSRSGGRFTVQRLATAEEMANRELDADMQAKRDKRLIGVKSKMIACFVYKPDGRIEFTPTADRGVISTILAYYKTKEASGRPNQAKEIITSTAPELIEKIISGGCKKLFRSYRYYDAENKPWVESIKEYPYDVIYTNKTFKENKMRNYTDIITETINEYVDNIVDGSEDDTAQLGGIIVSRHSPRENFG